MALSRRQALLTIGAGALLSTNQVKAAFGLSGQALYRVLVPEIFTNLMLPPTYTPNLVIGSGFGGSVAALRLAQAGQPVTVVERGFRWPNDPWRTIFSNDTLPDGRAFWFRTSAKMIAGNTASFDSFGGVMDVSVFPNMTAWHAACVGGGSVTFTGAMVQPQQNYFDALFNGVVSYAELNNTYYPLVRQMLNLTTMPADVYASSPFGHSREWDRQVSTAGYNPTPINSIFNWNVVRSELAGSSLPSATAGLSNHGNSNGAKFDLNQNYLKQAQATGQAKIYPGYEVLSIGRQNNRFVVQGLLRDPTGITLGTSTITCDRLFLAANSIGTTSLLVKAKAQGTLPNLNQYVGAGWGSNGDAIVVRSFGRITGLSEGTPCASMIHEPNLGLPVTFENWYVPGVPLNLGIIPSLGMAFDQSNRGTFTYDAGQGAAVLNWPANGGADTLASCRSLNNKITAASGTVAGASPFIGDVTGTNWTAHPLGGAVIGKATDAYGRVLGYPGLYVMDGTLLPGSAGAVNPSLTITALAERNIANIIRNAG